MSEYEQACARILRSAVADFRAAELSLSTLEHFVQRVENVATSLSGEAHPTPEPQSIRADAETCPLCGFRADADYYGPQFVCPREGCPKVAARVG